MKSAWFCSVVAGALVVLTGCGDDDDKKEDTTFYPCGVKVDSESTELRQCDRTKEVCICARNSCAVREDTPDGCRSGYRYVSDEFAEAAVRGICVEQELVSWRIDQTNLVKDCEALRVDAGVDAPMPDAGSGSGSGSATANGGVQ